jgi:hypothetical protein
VALSTSDTERIPKWYSVTTAIGCCFLVAESVAVTHGGTLARGIVGGIFALLSVALFWMCRVNFRKLLAKPLPRRGPRRWLTTQPVWMMVLGYLAYALALLVAIGVVLSIAHMPVAGFMLGAGLVCLLAALTQIAAWLELRRRQDAHSY